MSSNTAVISVRDLVVGFGDAPVLDHATLDVFEGEILGFVGGSGAGKSVLMRTIIGLLPKRNGSIEVLGTDLAAVNDDERRAVERRWGVLFQQGALFSSLTALQNVQFPIREYLNLSPRLIEEIALAKLEMVGLNADVRGKFPSELSGGMVKRVALARALVLKPELLFMDEPTAGLDPEQCHAVVRLIERLKEAFKLTVVLVTHDVDALSALADRVAVLADQHIVVVAPPAEARRFPHPFVHHFFDAGAELPARARISQHGE